MSSNQALASSRAKDWGQSRLVAIEKAKKIREDRKYKIHGSADFSQNNLKSFRNEKSHTARQNHKDPRLNIDNSFKDSEIVFDTELSFSSIKEKNTGRSVSKSPVASPVSVFRNKYFSDTKPVPPRNLVKSANNIKNTQSVINESISQKDFEKAELLKKSLNNDLGKKFADSPAKREKKEFKSSVVSENDSGRLNLKTSPNKSTFFKKPKFADLIKSSFTNNVRPSSINSARPRSKKDESPLPKKLEFSPRNFEGKKKLEASPNLEELDDVPDESITVNRILGVSDFTDHTLSIRIESSCKPSSPIHSKSHSEIRVKSATIIPEPLKYREKSDITDNSTTTGQGSIAENDIRNRDQIKEGKFFEKDIELARASLILLKSKRPVSQTSFSTSTEMNSKFNMTSQTRMEKTQDDIFDDKNLATDECDEAGGVSQKMLNYDEFKDKKSSMKSEKHAQSVSLLSANQDTIKSPKSNKLVSKKSSPVIKAQPKICTLDLVPETREKSVESRNSKEFENRGSFESPEQKSILKNSNSKIRTSNSPVVKNPTKVSETHKLETLEGKSEYIFKSPKSSQELKGNNENTAPVPKWKAQSEAFRANLRAARGEKLTESELSAIKNVSESEDLIQCKYCDRKFNEKAANRHISFCESKSKSGIPNKKLEKHQSRK